MPDTMLNVHLELENPTDIPQIVFFERGRCFEIAASQAELQNAALAESKTVVLPPRSHVLLDLPAHCLNRYRGMSGRNDANPTPFILATTSNDQEEVWEMVENPAA